MMTKFDYYLKRYLPTILSVLACGGVVGTAYVAIKQQEKAEEEIKSKSEITMHYMDNSLAIIHDSSFTDKQRYSILIKHHIPTVLMGLGTMACIVGSTGLSARMESGMISAYGLLNESYNKYRQKVIEHHGIDEHKKILSESALIGKPTEVLSPGPFDEGELQASLLSEKDKVWTVMDEFSHRYFKSTTAELISAEYELNRRLNLGELVLLNDWYALVNLEQTPEGNELGWYLGTDDDIFWIDFNNCLCIDDEDREFMMVSICRLPDMNWQRNGIFI